MTIRFDPIETKSMTKQIAEQIRQSIVEGVLKADDRLPTEHELAEQFHVSRPTIRESLKLLAAQNLIRSRRGPSGGTFVKMPSQEEERANLTTAATLMVSLGEFDLPQIIEARRELECLCGRLACENREESHLAIMREEIARQKLPGLIDEDFCASDVRFHRALVDASGNAVLQFLMCAVIEALQPVENMLIFRFTDRREIIMRHEAILAALERQDSSALVSAIGELTHYIEDQLDRTQASYRPRPTAG